MQTSLGIVPVQGGRGKSKQAGGRELENSTDINVLMAGTDIQEYFIKNNKFCFGGTSGPASLC